MFWAGCFWKSFFCFDKICRKSSVYRFSLYVSLFSLHFALCGLLHGYCGCDGGDIIWKLYYQCVLSPWYLWLRQSWRLTLKQTHQSTIQPKKNPDPNCSTPGVSTKLGHQLWGWVYTVWDIFLLKLKDALMLPVTQFQQRLFGLCTPFHAAIYLPCCIQATRLNNIHSFQHRLGENST